MIAKEISKKVLTISPDYKNPKGGIAQVVNSYSDLFDPFQHISTTKYSSKIGKVYNLFRSIAEFFKFIVFFDIEIVHIHVASYNSFWRKTIFIYLSKAFSKYVILHVHGAEFKDFHKTNSHSVNSVVNKCDLIIALSQHWKDYFEKELQHRNIVILENIVEKPIHRRDTLDDEYCRFLFLGELGKRKGIYDLLDVLVDLREQISGKAIFHIGGNGEVDKVKGIINANSLQELVKFEGWVSGEKKQKLLSKADVFILPSYNEGLPIAILEAMSYQVFVISTFVGGIPELVDNKINGLLIEPGDTDGLREAIEIAIHDIDFRNKAGLHSYEIIKPHLPSSVEEKLESIYARINSRKITSN
ncbi:glycosyltransferase family 4 protein [Gracilimonas sediminicola]|uniref:glycosyltransferase family 4 protein n=1 Tax=Gracilimonas sediminicola TaxID=2952158 RepID=UPI0038D5070D